MPTTLKYDTNLQILEQISTSGQFSAKANENT